MEEEKSENSVVIEKPTQKELVEDIKSLLKTGMTVSELEYLENLLKQIRKKWKKNLQGMML